MKIIKKCSECNRIFFGKSHKISFTGLENEIFCVSCVETVENRIEKEIRKHRKKEAQEFEKKIVGFKKIILPKTKIKLNHMEWEMRGSYNIEIFYIKKLRKKELIELVNFISGLSMEESFIGGNIYGDYELNGRVIHWRTSKLKLKLNPVRFSGQENAKTILEDGFQIIAIK